jgi:hypothetical protein
MNQPVPVAPPSAERTTGHQGQRVNCVGRRRSLTGEALLDDSTASNIRLSRDEAVLAQGFAESVADLLAPAAIAAGAPRSS